MKDIIALVAVGGNATSTSGNPTQTVRAAIAALGATFDIVGVSGLYRTPAFPAGSGPDFVNAACAFHTQMSSEDALQTLHDIEATFGRERTQRWGQRTLDLDLIAYGDTVAPDLEAFDHWRGLSMEAQQTRVPDLLILPHPRLQDRSFVLVPLADVAPDWTHPVLGLTVKQMRDARPQDEIDSVRPL